MISILLGLLVGYLRNGMDEDPTAGFPDHLEYGQFEQFVSSTYNTKDGQKHFFFRDITVDLVPDPLDKPIKQATSVVRKGEVATITVPDGRYRDGQKVKLSGLASPDYTGEFTVLNVTPNSFDIKVSSKAAQKPSGTLTVTAPQQLTYIVKGWKRPIEANVTVNGKRAYKPVPVYMLVPFAPYKPVMRNAPAETTSYHRSTFQRLFEALHIKQPDPPGSILDYLANVQAKTGNTFEYHWWSQPRVRLATWTAGCFVVFGLIFPTLINIMAFGSIFQPRREKKPSLRKVKSTATAAPQPKSKATDKDWEDLATLEAELEAKLVGDTITDKAPAPPTEFSSPTPQPQPTRKLSDEPAEAPAALPESDEHREFARKTGDFYPVERPATTKKDEHKH